MIITIDPGHGGRDPGAIGYVPWQLREADVVWSVSAIVRALLVQVGGAEVATTHPQGLYVGIGDRADASNDAGADLFVSIHCNSYLSDAEKAAGQTTQANGIEVLHYGSSGGEALAQEILDELQPVMDRYEIRNRGLKVRRDLGVLRLTNCPAALVELPFIKNPRELEILADAEFQVDVAEAIVDGILR